MFHFSSSRAAAACGLAIAGLLVLSSCGGGGGGGSETVASGTVTTLAGVAGQGGAADGAALEARFRSPEGVIADAGGRVYVADTGNNTIRRIAPDGTVSTLAGLAGAAGAADGTGASARFSAPRDLALDAGGNLYALGNEGLRKVTPAGVVTTLIGPGLVSYFALDPAGNLYTAAADGDVVRTTPAGVTSTAAPKPAVTADQERPFYRAIAADGQGNVYTAESTPNPAGVLPRFGRVRKFNAQGVQVASAEVVAPTGLAIDGTGRLLVSCGGTVANASPTGSTTACSGVLVFDGNFVPATLAGVSQVVRLPPDFAGGSGNADGPGLQARFAFPKDVAASATGIYVADTSNSTVRRIQP